MRFRGANFRGLVCAPCNALLSSTRGHRPGSRTRRRSLALVRAPPRLPLLPRRHRTVVRRDGARGNARRRHSVADCARRQWNVARVSGHSRRVFTGVFLRQPVRAIFSQRRSLRHLRRAGAWPPRRRHHRMGLCDRHDVRRRQRRAVRRVLRRRVSHRSHRHARHGAAWGDSHRDCDSGFVARLFPRHQTFHQNHARARTRHPRCNARRSRARHAPHPRMD